MPRLCAEPSPQGSQKHRDVLDARLRRVGPFTTERQDRCKEQAQRNRLGGGYSAKSVGEPDFTVLYQLPEFEEAGLLARIIDLAPSDFATFEVDDDSKDFAVSTGDFAGCQINAFRDFDTSKVDHGVVAAFGEHVDQHL